MCGLTAFHVPLKTTIKKRQEKKKTEALRHIIISTDGEEKTGTFRMGRGHWATDIYYSQNEL